MKHYGVIAGKKKKKKEALQNGYTGVPYLFGSSAAI